MARITVRAYYGTTCFVIGSSQLQKSQRLIPERYGEKVEIIRNPRTDLRYAD